MTLAYAARGVGGVGAGWRSRVCGVWRVACGVPAACPPFVAVALFCAVALAAAPGGCAREHAFKSGVVAEHSSDTRNALPAATIALPEGGGVSEVRAGKRGEEFTGLRAPPHEPLPLQLGVDSLHVRVRHLFKALLSLF